MATDSTTCMQVCALDQLTEGESLVIESEGAPKLAVHLLGGTVYVSNDTCPHAEASLAGGYLEDGRIVCPVHFAEFDLQTGDASNAPPGCPKLRLYPVSIKDGIIFAELS